MQINDIARLALAAGILVAGFALAGCEQKSATGKPTEAVAPEVAVIVVQPERVVLSSELPGRTSAHLVAEVRPQVSGIIQKRLFDEGGNVNAGDVLYQIDPSTYQVAYNSAKAALAKAEANLPPLRQKAGRYRELVPRKAVSQQDYDDIFAASKQAEAEIEVNKAAVEAARINLGYTRVTAPISGRIGKSNVTIGALVTAHQPAALATIQQLDPLYVDVTQSSANLLRLRQHLASGQIRNDSASQANVRLLMEDGAPYQHKGALKFRDVSVDPSSGSVTLRMIFANPDLLLLPGMYVRALVEEGVNEQAIMAPQQGVSRDQKGNPVALVVDGSDRVEQRLLKVDRAVGDRWLVSDGLRPGDRLIVEGFQRIRPGSTVRVQLFQDQPGATPSAGASVRQETEK